MYKRAQIWGAVVFMFMSFGVLELSDSAEIDWTVIKQFDIGSKPLDVAASDDGQMVFVLTKREIVVYSPDKNSIFKRIPLDQEFDKIEYSTRGSLLVLTSSTLNTLKVIRVDQIYPIDISGLAFKGPGNASVTIAVFDDYQ
ncbi:MAG TPA: hypothetical protein HPQ03_09535 [Deltaproteobacteria bacterium]|nr:hypothetical protein [Deltaproteobacteria bacterium]